MGRIAGIDLPDNKRVDIGLTAIYGIGRHNVTLVLAKSKVAASTRIKDLNQEEVSRLQAALDDVPIEGVLRQKISEDIKRLKSIGSYRGLRHSHNLPVRGQRTRSNARTKRGKRQTVGALKKEAETRQETPQTNE
ncbi:30S ribosomal protein S13 [Candidatus Shapirobacteria bacterium CG09_land_8_20_14_0_10_49_15]|uniref:Small ribosomal subunit protein uS13 n=2 Tax=Candidatus Shapironibacteriota TaxID=1752721 RepID=A0A2M8L6T9_9BACT|nr:MAG: 30S ribosomal protein S13 [Candidatus Shapirobacteria bacterium CG09_land_8_20_14_0_10_49_15]PJE69941.1 MAG: 30S ribosomal protein S13 [Candidatus Shapirobacteria bacterium CG10_big_fil_rev_8_21_14_0_10_48_15]